LSTKLKKRPTIAEGVQSLNSTAGISLTGLNNSLA